MPGTQCCTRHQHKAKQTLAKEQENAEKRAAQKVLRKRKRLEPEAGQAEANKTQTKVTQWLTVSKRAS